MHAWHGMHCAWQFQSCHAWYVIVMSCTISGDPAGKICNDDCVMLCCAMPSPCHDRVIQVLLHIIALAVDKNQALDHAGCLNPQLLVGAGNC